MDISQAEIDEVVRRALLEDLGAGDITTETLVPPDLHGTARIIAKAEGILAGVEIARTVFLAVDPTLDFKPILSDGAGLRVTDHSDENDLIAELSGSVASVLKGERVALNFLQHLSGIATETNRYVQKSPTTIRSYSTRGRRLPAFGACKSTRLPSAGARTIGATCRTGCSSRTTTSRRDV